MINSAGALSSDVKFLEGYDICVRVGDHLCNPVRVDPTICANAAVDIVSQNSEVLTVGSTGERAGEAHKAGTRFCLIRSQRTKPEADGSFMSVKRVILNSVMALGVLLAAYLLYTVFSRYSLDEIIQSVGSISYVRLAAALSFCALSYVCLTGFDWMALRYVGKPLSYPTTALASFTALSIGHNLGLAALSSGAIRYRYYVRWGLSPEEVAKVILFCGATVGLGLSTLAGCVALINPDDVGKMLRASFLGPYVLAGFCLLVPAAYVLMAGSIRAPLRVWKWRFEMPDVRLAIGQVVVGTLNFACVAACLHQVLAGAADATFIESATAFVLANIAVVITHVPGGLGVLEATVSTLLPEAASVGSLIAFRVIYFLVPLLAGLTILAISELAIGRQGKQRLTEGAEDTSEPQAQLL